MTKSQKFKVNSCDTIEMNIQSSANFGIQDLSPEKDKSSKRNACTVRNTSYTIKSSQTKLDKFEINHDEKVLGSKSTICGVSREIKPKYGAPFLSKCAFNKHPLSKRKYVPQPAHLTNSSTKVVLFERSVEIKDLESKAKFLQNRIKQLECENKTLHDVQSCQERELKKFKEGVADIPSLLKSHKEDIKVLDSTISTLRKNLRDCQKELKAKNEVILKKEHQIEKLNGTLKRNEKMMQDVTCELKEFKDLKKELEEGNRELLGTKENLKFENENLQSKIKEMILMILKHEEDLSNEKNSNKQLKDDLDQLQQKYDDMQQKVSIGLPVPVSSKETNNVIVEDLSECLTQLSPKAVVSRNTVAEKVSVVHEFEGKAEVKEKTPDKVKEALIHTFKRYQNICSGAFDINTINTTFGTMTNSLKPLPPLKQAPRKYSSVDSRLAKDQFASSMDINVKLKEGNRSLEGGTFTKGFLYDFQISEIAAGRNSEIPATRELKKKKFLF